MGVVSLNGLNQSSLCKLAFAVVLGQKIISYMILEQGSFLFGSHVILSMPLLAVWLCGVLEWVTVPHCLGNGLFLFSFFIY